MSIKKELKDAGVYVIAYWDTDKPNFIMLTSVEREYNYIKRGRGFRPATSNEEILYQSGTRCYEKKVHN